MDHEDEVATLAGGCFVCLASVYEQIPGVRSVQCGYTGGAGRDRTSANLRSEGNGGAEAVEIAFDPAKISYAELLDLFFAIHDPTDLAFQFHGGGAPYRSAIFFHSPRQQQLACDTAANKQTSFPDPIVTQVVAATSFHQAIPHPPRHDDRTDRARCATPAHRVAASMIRLCARQAEETMAQRHHAEDQARRVAAYLAQGERMAHAASWSVNLRTKAMFWSDEHFRIFGLPVGKPITLAEALAMIHREDRDAAMETWERAVAAAKPYELQFRVVRPDGAVRHVRSIGRPVLDDAGAVEEFVGTLIDETERREADEALARARQQLTHVSRVTTVGQLASSIAHEVNQPLGAISANALACMHWMAADPPDVTEARSGVQRILRDADRAGAVIRQIRAFLTRGTSVEGPVRIDEVASEAVALLAGEARDHGVALEAHAEPGMPETTGDRIQLQQVLVNLVMNAIDALAPVTDRPRQVILNVARHSTVELRVTVRDNGGGIPPQDIDRVFQGFYTTKTEGLGMGLAISRTIVEAHGGRLWASAHDGPGTTFTLSLPMAAGGSP